MDFSHVNQGSRKSGKFVLVAALHVALGIMFVHGMNTRKLSIGHEPIFDFIPMPPEVLKPPPPPPQPEFKATAQPKIVVPTVEDVVVEHARPDVIRATTDHGPDVVAPPGPDTVVKEVLKPAPAQPPAMRTAVLANANACALPEYPESALRNEEEGTTTLALLVGTDGRVSSARVEHSSGHRQLDRAAVVALSLCQFKPATNNGVPEAGWAKLAYVWKLS